MQAGSSVVAGRYNWDASSPHIRVISEAIFKMEWVVFSSFLDAGIRAELLKKGCFDAPLAML